MPLLLLLLTGGFKGVLLKVAKCCHIQAAARVHAEWGLNCDARAKANGRQSAQHLYGYSGDCPVSGNAGNRYVATCASQDINRSKFPASGVTALTSGKQFEYSRTKTRLAWVSRLRHHSSKRWPYWRQKLTAFSRRLFIVPASDRADTLTNLRRPSLDALDIRALVAQIVASKAVYVSPDCG
jgi:hypothetical protein